MTVPMVTQTEKGKRRQALKEKRRRCGKKRRPLPRARPGADQRYKEFKIAAGYDESQEHRLTLTARLKGSGMRWEASNAESLMALEALSQSGIWKTYWQSELRKAG